MCKRRKTDGYIILFSAFLSEGTAIGNECIVSAGAVIPAQEKVPDHMFVVAPYHMRPHAFKVRL
jgi:carbonic anhydrase/acetyltransferase-like protein (isoleucine patch superfamily)